MTSRSWDDIQTRLEARRTPVARPALHFTGEPLAYWRGEVAQGCAVAMARLRALCRERQASYELTVERLAMEACDEQD